MRILSLCKFNINRMASIPYISLFLISSLLWLQSLAVPTERQQVCNGYAELCDRQYSNISFIGTHDSAFVGDLLTDNQDISVSAQLSAGIRFLQAQTHVLDGNLELCHTSCAELDAGSLQNYLSTIKSFLDANPNEVITLLLVNGDFQSPTLFDTTFQSAGLNTYAFIPSTSPNDLTIDEWPTLAEMISAGQRLVVFLGMLGPRIDMASLLTGSDYDANTTEVPYILEEFNYFFETPYDTTDPTFPECSIDRPSGASATGRMYLVNHFLDIDILGIDIPDEMAASTTNAATGSGSIGAQVGICVGLYGRYPNVVLLDYFDQGSPGWSDAQNTMNGV